jgi:hypothetical protein
MNAPLPHTVFDRLPGHWSFERTFSNGATMLGVAVFEPIEDGRLRYRESGMLSWHTGQAWRAQRTYLYSRLPAGFAVWFDEQPPRLFHEIVLASAGDALASTATHLCVRDRYDTVYTFGSDGSFTIRHDVAGPAKDYASVTRFRRAERDSPDGSPGGVQA